MGHVILLVQVSPVVRYAVRNAVQDSEYTPGSEARTFAEGFHFFESARPDAVVLDMTLSPHETTQELRRFHKRFPMSRILMVYSHISRPNLAEARRAGVSEMVLFPFSRESFLESLDRLIGKGQKGPGPEPTAPP